MGDLSREQLEDIVRAAVADHGAAGFGVAVLTADRVHQVSVGQANPERGMALTDDTLVQIGSTTKLLNAALIMRLADEGVLDLDQPVAEVVGGFRLADEAAAKTLTLRHCLTMTSGMDGGPFHDFGSAEDCLARYVESLADVPHLFTPAAALGTATRARSSPGTPQRPRRDSGGTTCCASTSCSLRAWSTPRPVPTGCCSTPSRSG